MFIYLCLLLARTASRCRRAYILPLWFFLSFFFVFLLCFSSFRRLISEVTERISTKLVHIFTYDCYLKNLVQTPRAFTCRGLGQKPLFGTDVELDQRNLISTIGKKLVNLQRCPTCPPNLVNFGPETADSGWRVLPTP